MAVLRMVWAAHYPRWAAILSVTAGVHAAAFCLYVSGGGTGGGPPVPEGRVTLYLARTDAPCETPLTPVRSTVRPLDARPAPVECAPDRTPPGPLPPTPRWTELHAPNVRPTACDVSQARRPEDRVAAASEARMVRTAGAACRDTDRPLVLGEGLMPPRIVVASRRNAGGSSPEGSTFSSRSPGQASASAVAAGGEEGLEPDFALDGRPVYPIECRRGDCNGHAPCEGFSRWRIAVGAPDATPSRIECLRSSGCARLDASVERFLREARVPRAGVFSLRFRFKLDGR